MKLEPRVRQMAKLYEMDGDSNYLLMFKDKNNAHLYSKNGKKKPVKKAKKSVAASSKKKKKAIPTPPLLTKKESDAAGALARKGSQTHRWEFFNDFGSWSKYAVEANKLVEMEYQSWLMYPAVSVRSVRSGDWHYSVDFNKLEQTNINHPAHKVRKIRRVPNDDTVVAATSVDVGSSTIAAAPSAWPSSPAPTMSTPLPPPAAPLIAGGFGSSGFAPMFSFGSKPSAPSSLNDVFPPTSFGVAPMEGSTTATAAAAPSTSLFGGAFSFGAAVAGAVASTIAAVPAVAAAHTSRPAPVRSSLPTKKAVTARKK